VIDKYGPDRTAIRDGLAEIKDVPSVIFGKATFDPQTRRVAGAARLSRGEGRRLRPVGRQEARRVIPFLPLSREKVAEGPDEGREGPGPSPQPSPARAGEGAYRHQGPPAFELLHRLYVNGLVIGNIYALLAVGLALIFGVANLINFAHGSVYTLGAYIGWAAITFLHTPLPATMAIVVVACAGVGVLIERVGLRPLQGRARIAPLLATIGISFVLDQIVQLVFSPDPRAVPNDLPDWRLTIGGGSIGALDLLIAAVGLVSAGLLFAFLRFTRLGFAVRATAQDREAAQQMGVDVDTVK